MVVTGDRDESRGDRDLTTRLEPSCGLSYEKRDLYGSGQLHLTQSWALSGIMGVLQGGIKSST